MRKKKLLFLLIVLAIICILGGCGDGSVKRVTCTKCRGSGRIRDPYGYYAYITCTKCHGRGYFVYTD